MALELNGTTGVSAVQAGAVESGDLPAGSVIQVVQETVTAASAFSVAGGLARTSNIISANITPSSSSNKVLITCYFKAMATTPSMFCYLQFNGSDIFLGDAAGSRERVSGVIYTDPDRSDSGNYVTLNFLHEPSTTSTATYSVKLAHSSSSTQTIYFNRNEDDLDSNNRPRFPASITLMEIAG